MRRKFINTLFTSLVITTLFLVEPEVSPTKVLGDGTRKRGMTASECTFMGEVRATRGQEGNTGPSDESPE